jgi:hypothetical protein
VEIIKKGESPPSLPSELEEEAVLTIASFSPSLTECLMSHLVRVIAHVAEQNAAVNFPGYYFVNGKLRELCFLEGNQIMIDPARWPVIQRLDDFVDLRVFLNADREISRARKFAMIDMLEKAGLGTLPEMSRDYFDGVTWYVSLSFT